MDEQNEYRSSRNDLRKKRTMNRIMNVSIGVVVVLIGFFMYHLLFSSSDEVADEEEPAPEQIETDDEVDENDDAIEESDSEEELSEEELTEPIEEDEVSEDGEGNDGDNDAPLGPPEDGNFEPVGTEQESLDFTFTEGTQNRYEMMRAIEYATGIPESDWDYLDRIENNGGVGQALGRIFYEGVQYEIEMEWVEGEGWMPLNVSIG
ncbi:YrrS family protein [Geomicrobium sediminis]|uniref:DUF1510 domain-containing protein n=1 Tax=Geomicrobium sediminis TaxID=1347788 RepID=A0ABS2PEN0_9BACL|nr:YrrS family protein [Geomicrobium sediminis]MBM7633890.1 hypothetical protein [Geomicrobium sediminis]